MAGRADVVVPFVTADWEGEVEKVERSPSRVQTDSIPKPTTGWDLHFLCPL
jgi:hypothetical protein